MSPATAKGERQMDGRKRYLTVDEVGEELELAPSTVRKEIAAGKIKAKRFGRNVRVHLEELARYEEESNYEPGVVR